MKVILKSHDESGSLDELKVMKWGYKYYTTDTQIPLIQERADKKRNRDAGSTRMFGSSGGGIQMAVIIGNKMKLERLPDDIKNFNPRSPTQYRFKHVKYNTKGNTLFINYFSEVSK